MKNVAASIWAKMLNLSRARGMQLDEVVRDFSGCLLPVITGEVIGHRWVPSKNWQPIAEQS